MTQQQAYTNYGYLDGLRDVNIIPLRLDTWYYDGELEVGRITFDRSECDGVPVGDFLSRQVLSFAEAFSSFVRLRNGFVLNCRSADVAAYTREIVGADLSESLALLKERTNDLSHVTVVDGRFDMRVAIRDHGGTIKQQRLSNIGSLTLYRPSKPRSEHVRDITVERRLDAWRAQLSMGVTSVFLRDNSVVLRRVRERWRELQAQNPTLTWDNSAEPIAPLVVTLATPPLGTPADNAELHELNAPLLYEAVSRWEQITGRKFKWAIPQP